MKSIINTDSDKISTPLDLFDALPPSIQRNHKLIKAFCQWYLLSKDHNLRTGKKDKRISRSTSYYFRDKIQAKTLELHQENPTMKSPAILDHPDMKALIKEARANKEAVGEPDTWKRWIQKIIKMKKERGWDKSS